MHSLGRTSKFGIAELGVKKLETSLYRIVQSYFDILNRLGVTHETDRRTDRQTDFSRKSAALHYIAWPKIICYVHYLLAC